MRASPILAAIQTASGETLAGLHWTPGLVITDGARLPVQEAYSVALPIGHVVAATLLRHDPGGKFGRGLAALKLVEASPVLSLDPGPPPSQDAVLLVLGADADAAPIARLTVADEPVCI
ncbi:MAG: hypothetical protein ACREF3_07540, partial [Acetobacteraceae bacterium]